ncbi:MAG: pyridoxal phosphate-dependent aminotransferase [Firmicutes bacterium]|nr:pyridoxal phosphate-dependent aminotransferase [Bacillota bacterium]
MLSKKALAISPSPTMAIDSKAKEMQSQGIDVIGFGAGEPDFDTPALIRDEAIRAINEGHTRYTPAAGTLEVREAICSKLLTDNGLSYKPSQIVVSNGAKHSINNVLAALLNPGDEVLIPTPYWVSYPEMVRLNDGIPVAVETELTNNLKATVDDLRKSLSSKSKALILNSPSNPTGQVYSKEELTAIADFCIENKIFVISDEIYEKLIYGQEKHFSIAAFNEKIKDLTIVVNGVSKSYAMTGWRIGYTASSVEIATVMANIQSHTASNPNSIAQKATVAALKGQQDSVAEMRRAFEKRRRYIFERINSLPYLKALEPQGAFYIFVSTADALGKSYRNNKLKNSDHFAALLLENQKVAVVPGTGFGAPDYVRLSFATSMEKIVEGLNRLEIFINEIK